MKINGFNLYRRDRVDDNHGGICVYINQSISLEDVTSNFHNLNVFGLRFYCITGKNCWALFIDHQGQTT